MWPIFAEVPHVFAFNCAKLDIVVKRCAARDYFIHIKSIQGVTIYIIDAQGRVQVYFNSLWITICKWAKPLGNIIIVTLYSTD